jgi:outer membrane protein
MKLFLLVALVAPPASIADSLPRITLAEALARSARLDPNYVRALGDVHNAAWARRAARSAMVLPSLSVATDYTRFSIEQLNVGTGVRTPTSATARIDARFELFTGFRKISELHRANAEVDAASAGEEQQRFLTALDTESDFYAVLSNRELLQVSLDRLSRAQEQFIVARARVMSGAAVQTDSLQLLLELNRAHISLLQDSARLRVARLLLGRRVGVAGGVDAMPLDTTRAPDLPLSLQDAMTLALEQGPEYRVARANQRAAEASVRGARSRYFPQAVMTANNVTFGDNFYPHGLTRSTVTLQVSIPLWDNAQRELALARARSTRDVARAVREDLERVAEADVTEAWEAYQTARATADFSFQGVGIALETFRVQQARYRAGASTILDLLDAQSALTQAQAELVQARYAARLALAGLEAILGRRLFSDKDSP